MKAENRLCQNCKADFVIEPDDFGFYEKIKVPPPTFCPECRRQRRWAWRNNMSLYNRKCDLCEKPVISIYSPDSGLTIYCNKCWWSDKWDPKSYAVDYDFSKPFFTQFNELMKRVPHMAVVNDDGIASLNCEYTHDWWFSKNCYLCFSGWHVENVMYSFFILAGKYVMDCMELRSKNEYMYECRLCSKNYQLKYSDVCKACINSAFLYDCDNCQDCLMCVNLRSKKHCFKNQQYTKEEYEKILNGYKLDTFSGVEKAKKEFKKFVAGFPKRYGRIFHCVNSTGDTLSGAKNITRSFGIRNANNLKYCDFVGDSTGLTQDCWDITTTGGSSECYECMVGDHSQLNLFGLFSVKSQDIKYCQHCHNCKHGLGCVGLRNTDYAIFNKQYSKEEYEKLVPKIIKHMNDMPYVDKQKFEYKYGEFYPIELSPLGYNETYAPELVPLAREEAIKRGYKWQDNIQKTMGKETIQLEKIPDSINDIGEEILEEILKCIDCKRNYKIIKNEFLFYKKMEIPIPRKCFMCRYKDRVTRRNPLNLWHRQCMCEKINHFHGEGRCQIEFETTYAPERPEIVYCEKCYQQEVY